MLHVMYLGQRLNPLCLGTCQSSFRRKRGKERWSSYGNRHLPQEEAWCVDAQGGQRVAENILSITQFTVKTICVIAHLESRNINLVICNVLDVSWLKDLWSLLD